MILDRRLPIIACIIYLVYFTGISAYSILEESTFHKILYYINDTVLKAGSTFILSIIFTNKIAKILIRGAFVFLIILGTFQILCLSGYSVENIYWILVCPAFILSTLILSLILSFNDKRTQK